MEFFNPLSLVRIHIIHEVSLGGPTLLPPSADVICEWGPLTLIQPGGCSHSDQGVQVLEELWTYRARNKGMQNIAK